MQNLPETHSIFHMIYTVIVAAGEGKRFGTPLPKQFIELDGVPIWLRALKPFAERNSVGAIVLVVPRSQVSAVRREVEKTGWKKPIRVLAGGHKRQDSVKNGLDQVARLAQSGGKGRKPRDPIVLIHDGARPLVSPELIGRVVKATEKYGAAVPGFTPRDTIKLIDVKTGLVEKTPPRERLREIQTPQGFKLSILVKGYKILEQGGLAVTDDSSLVELAGADVRVVPGDPQNIKITTPMDLWTAEGLVKIQKSKIKDQSSK